MNFNAFLPLKGLTTIASVCFICKRETHSDSQSPRPTRRQAALHHRNPARLLAPSPHPPSHRLCRLRPRPRPLSLGFDRQLSRRTHQADQPLRRTENHGPTVVAQLPETEGHLGAHLRVEPAAPAPGEESMTRIAEPQLSFADLELRNQGVHLDPLLQGIVGFLDDHAPLVEQVRQDLARGLKNPNTGRGGITPSQTLRSLILMRVKNWDYREFRERINDGYAPRLLPTSTATVCPSTTPSTAPLPGSPRPPCKPSTKPWSRVPSNSAWKTASGCAWTPRWWKPTSISPPMPPCCGTRCARSRDWSTSSIKNCPAEYAALPIAPVARAAACKRSSACRPPSGTRSKSPSTANYSASPGRCWKARARSSRRPPRSRVSTCSATWPSTNSASRSRLTATWARRSLTTPVGGYSTESRFLPTRKCTPSSSPTRI